MVCLADGLAGNLIIEPGAILDRGLFGSIFSGARAPSVPDNREHIGLRQKDEVATDAPEFLNKH